MLGPAVARVTETPSRLFHGRRGEMTGAVMRSASPYRDVSFDAAGRLTRHGLATRSRARTTRRSVGWGALRASPDGSVVRRLRVDQTETRSAIASSRCAAVAHGGHEAARTRRCSRGPRRRRGRYAGRVGGERTAAAPTEGEVTCRRGRGREVDLRITGDGRGARTLLPRRAHRNRVHDTPPTRAMRETVTYSAVSALCPG